jgi:hypothetical protein
LAGTLDHGSDHEAIIEGSEEDSWDSAVDNGVPVDKEERVAWAERKKRHEERIAKTRVETKTAAVTSSKAARQSKRDVSIASAVAKEKRELAMEVQTMRDESFAAVMKDTTVRKLAGLKELAQQGADHKMKLQEAREHAASLRARQHALDEKVDRLAARYVTSGKFSPGKAQDVAEARYAAEAVELKAFAAEDAFKKK